ncbi:hypothetical protein C2G38_968747 [Gigaspora rosea]|uniref:Galactose oxidase n=1 Tax=Gigaspora rosea TaxID=44941 RepID=A0A397W4R6_9GLOM|nr:hypothetical protein C2G38_968747 [Gigaspora rosea]
MMYFNLYIFALLLNFIFTFANFAPPGRCGHNAVLVDKKLYFHSGFNGDNGGFNLLKDFFNLDVSQNFTTKTLPWNDLTFTGVPPKPFASACGGGNNNDLIFIFEGLSAPFNNISFTSQFDISNQRWTNVISPGNGPVKVEGTTSCAKFNNGSIAIIAGSINVNPANDLWIFDTLKLTWSLNNEPNTPPRVYTYHAITLPDQTILYIGGCNDYIMPMDRLFLYDTASNTWKSLTTTGPTPPDRRYSSAVLTSDKRIIVFGGVNENDDAFGDLWILDIERNPYQWSARNISNPNGLTLCLHTATLVDDYMIVAFGTNNINYSSTIYMLDVSQRDSYKWVTEFIPRTTNTTNFN